MHMNETRTPYEWVTNCMWVDYAHLLYSLLACSNLIRCTFSTVYPALAVTWVTNSTCRSHEHIDINESQTPYEWVNNYIWVKHIHLLHSILHSNISHELHIYESRTYPDQWCTNSTWVGLVVNSIWVNHIRPLHSILVLAVISTCMSHRHVGIKKSQTPHEWVTNSTWMSHELHTSGSSSQIRYIHYTVPCTRGNVSHELHIHESQTCRDKRIVYEWVTNSTWVSRELHMSQISQFWSHLLQNLLNTRFLCYVSKFPQTYVRTHACTHTQVSYVGRKQETKDMLPLG